MFDGSLVSIDDLSNEQIEDVLDLAREMKAGRDAFHGLASGRIMASLFLEPSTRTRGSFEAAMKRLGGDTITTADARSTSMEKGESLADTVRIWAGYADLIVLRHPWEGAARLAAQYSDVPVINAGDGGHEHPTQTLLDIYTLREEFGTLAGLRVVLCGDLKHGRTVHSLIFALLRFGADVILAPGEGLGLPDHVLRKIETEYQRPIQRVRHRGLQALYDDGPRGSGQSEGAIYLAPSQPHTLSLFDAVRLRLGGSDGLAFYVTRRQVERQGPAGEGSKPKYPRLDGRKLKRKDFSMAVILHPLPRVDELSPALDTDGRSRYFHQARNGVPVRMALIALMLGLKPWMKGAAGPSDGPSRTGQPILGPRDISCANPGCVTRQEPQSTRAEFRFFREPRLRFVCSYCEREVLPQFYGYPWGEVYHLIDEPPYHPFDPGTFAFFVDEETARASGLRVPKRPGARSGAECDQPAGRSLEDVAHG